VTDSLGLLPSGPDPVGESHARTNLPGRGIAHTWRQFKCPATIDLTGLHWSRCAL